MRDREAYHIRMCALCAYLSARLDEDDVYAGATRRPRLYRAWSVTQQRQNIYDYHRTVARRDAAPRPLRAWWEILVRYHAFCLRLAARPYAGRPGFDPAWLRAR